MPSICRIACENCDKPEGGVVSKEEGKRYGTIVSDFNLSLLLEGEREEMLRHPGEGRRLEAMGYTWERARKEGILVATEPVICLKCGTVNESKRLLPPDYFGCFGGLLVLFGFGIFVFLMSLGKIQAWPLALVCVGFVFRVITALAQNKFKGKFKERIERLRLKSCSNCQGTDFVHLRKIRDKMPCPKCGQTSLTCEHIGIS